MDDLRDRLEQLSRRVDERPEPLARLEVARRRRTRRRRVGTIFLALSVASAGTVGVVVAFGDAEPTHRTVRGPEPLAILTIWPESPFAVEAAPSAEEVQSALDAGDPEVAWRSDPENLARAFARRFLSWGAKSLEPVRAEGAVAGGMAKYRLSSCPVGASCYIEYEEVVTLIQPARQGEGGIWSVASVQGDVDVSVSWTDPAPTLEAGSTLEIRGAGGGSVSFGLRLWDGCGLDRYNRTARSGFGRLAVPDFDHSCAPFAAGYLFAAQGAEVGAGWRDPLQDPKSMPSITIVPVYVEPAHDKTAPDIEPIQTYTDERGWSLDYPASWSVLLVDWFNGRSSEMGAAFSNEPLVPVTAQDGTGQPFPDLSKLSPEGVVLIVTHFEGGPAPTIADDSSFPLPSEGAAILNAEPPLDHLLVFRGDGLAFWARFGSYDDAPAEVRETLDAMISSIRFEPWALSDIRNGWLAIGEAPPVGKVSTWEPEHGSLLVVVNHGGRLEGVGLIPGCGDGQTVSFAEGYVVLRCPDGAMIRYNLHGIGRADNPASVPDEVQTPVAFRSWDGMALVSASPDRGEGS
jgi:hypothetical protein